VRTRLSASLLRPVRTIAWLSIAGLFVWVFSGALLRGGIWVFRDSGHYYYPLLRFAGQQLAAGAPALWNPLDNLGVPLAGNPTASLFYPPAWIFALPSGDGWTYRLYVLGHAVLALATSYRLARRWNASPAAATVAALSYVFCGNVLYQVCNVIFLVGAAWMPLALLAAERMLRRRSLAASLALAAVLAAMTLGGDPQSAYHVGLLAGLYAILLWWRKRRGGRSDAMRGAAQQAPSGGGWPRPALLAVSATGAFLLAAVQVLPSSELTGQSSRYHTEVARNLYELVSVEGSAGLGPGRSWSDGLLCRNLDRAMHHNHVYHFSVGPWRMVEYLWPNVMGRQFPTHRRWAAGIPAEGRLWVPSLYMGLVPLALALAAVRFRRGDCRTVWLSWSALLAVVASFGWFGAGWIGREVFAASGGGPGGLGVGPPVGGLYWLMTVLLPGYIYFRYPAKLLTLAAVLLSMLAAFGWDRAFKAPGARLRRVVFWFGCASLAGGAVALGIWLRAPEVFRGVPPDVMFGPLDARGAAADIVQGFFQSACCAFLFWWLLGRASGSKQWPQCAAIILVAVDLGLANAWLLPTADARLWQQPGWLANELGSPQAESSVPLRLYRRPVWAPARWRSAGSPDRLREGLVWDRASGWPNHHLGPRLAMAAVYATIMPHDYQVFLWYAKRRGTGRIPNGDTLASIAVQFAVLRGDESLAGGRLTSSSDGAGRGGRSAGAPEDVSLWRLSGPLPRAWLAPRIEVLPPPATGNWRTLWRRTGEVFYPQGRRRDLRAVSVVEANPDELAGAGIPEEFCSRPGVPAAGSRAASAGVCRITRYEPTRVELEVDSAEGGLVVLADQYYPGWTLRIETAGQGGRSAPILRANRLMRGAWVPGGRHRLIFRYRPPTVFWGGALSAAGWLGLVLVGGIAWRRRRKRRGAARARPHPESRRTSPADRSVSHYPRRLDLPPNPAGLSGGFFGFPLPAAARPPPKSRRLARRILRLPTTRGGSPSPKIPPACPADSSASHYPRAARPPPKSRRLARRIVRFPTTRARLALPHNPAGHARRILRLPTTRARLASTQAVRLLWAASDDPAPESNNRPGS